MTNPKIYVKPGNLTGPLGFNAWEEIGFPPAIQARKRQPDFIVPVPKEIQEDLDATDLRCWYDYENDRTYVSVSCIYQNQDLLWVSGIVPGDDLLQEYKKLAIAEREWLSETITGALSKLNKNRN